MPIISPVHHPQEDSGHTGGCEEGVMRETAPSGPAAQSRASPIAATCPEDMPYR